MTDIQTLIHLNIEIEGLLHVLATRDNENARQLLGKKFDEYKALIEGIISGNHADNIQNIEPLQQVAETLTHDEVKDEEAVEAEEADETDLATAAIERGQKEQLNDIEGNDDEDDDLVAIIDTEEEESQPVEQPVANAPAEQPTVDATAEQPVANAPVETAVAEVVEKTTTQINTEEHSQSVNNQIDDDLAQAANDTSIAQQPEDDKQTPLTVNEAAPAGEKVRVEQAISRIGARDLRRAFTLNDKFRFRRYLFDNNDVDFAQTLDRLSAMPHYAEAYNYLIEKRGWDPHNEDVKDFLSIVENHFA